MNRQEYINTILEYVDGKAVKREIEKELLAHIDDREQYYREIGYDDETAAQKAIEHMGSPEAAADGFAKVHKKSRRVTIALTVLTLLSSAFVFMCFWLIIIFANGNDSTMGLGIAEAMSLMYVIGLSVIGKRINSQLVCSVAIIDFIILYCFYFLFVIAELNFNELCSRIVLKLACLLTGDFDCLSAFWQVGGITVAPYLTYLSIAFYAVIFVLLILVTISVEMLKNPTYGLRTKQFAKRVFKTQKIMWFFIAATILLTLPNFGSFDEQAEMTVKTNTNFNAIIIAQSDTPRPISEIPMEDILIIDSNYDWSYYILEWYTHCSDNANIITCSDTESLKICDSWYGYSVEKECGNKLKYKVAKFDIPCYLTKEYVYIEFITDLAWISAENAYEFASDSSENWCEVNSIGEISAAVDAYNQIEIIIEKSP